MTAAAAFRAAHDEVRDALAVVASERGVAPTRGERVRADRRSTFEYLGISTPDRRRRVAAGFSFTSDTPRSVLQVWDGIWRYTDNGDVLFAVLDFYRRQLPDNLPSRFWDVARDWIDRVDNWAHADDLARLFSFVLAHDNDTVLPTIHTWSLSDQQWHRRVAVVSLIHYSGKKAVFLPVDTLLDVVRNCIDDQRTSVAKAVGWVLREMWAVYPDDVVDFLTTHGDVMSPVAVRRAIEQLPTDQRSELRARLR